LELELFEGAAHSRILDGGLAAICSTIFDGMVLSPMLRKTVLRSFALSIHATRLIFDDSDCPAGAIERALLCHDSREKKSLFNEVVTIY